jgi:hypothetical protein
MGAAAARWNRMQGCAVKRDEKICLSSFRDTHLCVGPE